MSQNRPSIPDTAPFTDEQIRWLNDFFASLKGEQMAWLHGFVNGVMPSSAAPMATATAVAAAQGAAAQTASAGSAPAASAESAAAAAPTPLTVLYGSESGNAEELSETTAKKAKNEGFKPTVINMADVDPSKLEGVENLFVLVSTWGEGDPPENATDFYAKFMGESAPRMANTRFSVLSLGDTSYEHFCQMGKDFDARLENLGAERIHPRQDCDVDYDDDYEAWVKGALAQLKELAQAAPEGNGGAEGATATEEAPARSAAPEAPAEPVKYSRKNPFPAEMTERLQLTGRGSAKETIHCEFSLEGSGLNYEVGDALAVIPENAPDVVNDLLEAAGLDGDAQVSIKDGEFTLREALATHLDVTGLSLPVMKRYAELTQNPELEKLIDPENKERLQSYLYGRQVVDMLADFPSDELTPEALASLMRKLPPRLYSIASSPKAHAGEVHLTVGVVRYDAHGRRRKGVCSTYLADLIEVGHKVPVFVSPNKNFKLPDDPEAPIIMVGPGTGIAPFRAFVEERQTIGATGKNWLIFGEQHYVTDFLYQTEWQSFLKDGILHRLDVAFSRDQPEKVYVQDRMLDNSADIFAWLEDGAYFYVCGDATRMAVDVDKALHTIIEREGDKSHEDAAAYVDALKKNKRYQRDVY